MKIWIQSKMNWWHLQMLENVGLNWNLGLQVTVKSCKSILPLVLMYNMSKWVANSKSRKEAPKILTSMKLWLYFKSYAENPFWIFYVWFWDIISSAWKFRAKASSVSDCELRAHLISNDAIHEYNAFLKDIEAKTVSTV